jgi:hypothetical protein
MCSDKIRPPVQPTVQQREKNVIPTISSLGTSAGEREEK